MTFETGVILRSKKYSRRAAWRFVAGRRRGKQGSNSTGMSLTDVALWHQGLCLGWEACTPSPFMEEGLEMCMCINIL